MSSFFVYCTQELRNVSCALVIFNCSRQRFRRLFFIHSSRCRCRFCPQNGAMPTLSSGIMTLEHKTRAVNMHPLHLAFQAVFFASDAVRFTGCQSGVSFARSYLFFASFPFPLCSLSSIHRYILAGSTVGLEQKLQPVADALFRLLSADNWSNMNSGGLRASLGERADEKCIYLASRVILFEGSHSAAVA